MAKRKFIKFLVVFAGAAAALLAYLANTYPVFNP